MAEPDARQTLYEALCDVLDAHGDIGLGDQIDALAFLSGQLAVREMRLTGAESEDLLRAFLHEAGLGVSDELARTPAAGRPAAGDAR